MKTIVTLFLCFCASGLWGQSKTYDYCYTRGGTIRVYSVAGKIEVPIMQASAGQDACISPDGKKVAFTINYKDGGRNIGIVDLNTKLRTQLNTGSNNCFGPMWSPDGNYIAYQVFDQANSNWLIAIIGTQPDSQPKILTAQLPQCYSPTWAGDSKHVVTQDMTSVYIIDLSGNVTTSYKISDLAQTDGASSSDRFILTNDGTKLIFSVEMNEPGFSDGPPSAAFAYDIATKSSVRLSPKGYYCDGVFVKGNKVLFAGGRITSKIENVYSVDLDGKNLKVLFPNAREISAKN